MTARFYRGAGPWHGRHVSYEGFDFNEAGIARCAVGPELHRAVSDVTANALEYAQLIAPADRPDYAAGFRSDVREIPDFPYRVRPNPPMPRWGGYVQNVSRSAILVEVGAQDHADYRVLGRTLEWLELVADN